MPADSHGHLCGQGSPLSRLLTAIDGGCDGLACFLMKHRGMHAHRWQRMSREQCLFRHEETGIEVIDLRTGECARDMHIAEDVEVVVCSELSTDMEVGKESPSPIPSGKESPSPIPSRGRGVDRLVVERMVFHG